MHWHCHLYSYSWLIVVCLNRDIEVIEALIVPIVMCRHALLKSQVHAYASR